MLNTGCVLQKRTIFYDICALVATMFRATLPDVFTAVESFRSKLVTPFCRVGKGRTRARTHTHARTMYTSKVSLLLLLLLLLCDTVEKPGKRYGSYVHLLHLWIPQSWTWVQFSKYNPIQSIKSITYSNPIHNDDVNADPNPIQSI